MGLRLNSVEVFRAGSCSEQAPGLHYATSLQTILGRAFVKAIQLKAGRSE